MSPTRRDQTAYSAYIYARLEVTGRVPDDIRTSGVNVIGSSSLLIEKGYCIVYAQTKLETLKI